MKVALATSAVIALVAVAADCFAQQTPSEKVTIERREVTISPQTTLVASGTVALALGYGVATVLGISSTYDKDRLLFIPIAGPWIDLGLRPPSTKEENWARFGLVVDGVAQLAGVVLLVTGFILHQRTHARSVAALVTPNGGGVSFSF